MSNVTAIKTTSSNSQTHDGAARVKAALAEMPDGVIEAIARQCGVPSRMVLEALPREQRVLIPPERFDTVWAELTGWGEVLFIVHTADIVAEIAGSLPPGSHGHGYFNIHGDSPIGGHIRAANCQAIYIVDRPFHGKRSCSVQFFNAEGEAMFKVFVRRGADRQMLTEQLLLFEALKEDYA